MRTPRDVFEKNQLKILKDTVRNPFKSLLGGPNEVESETILRDKYKATDSEILELKG